MKVELLTIWHFFSLIQKFPEGITRSSASLFMNPLLIILAYLRPKLMGRQPTPTKRKQQ